MNRQHRLRRAWALALAAALALPSFGADGWAPSSHAAAPLVADACPWPASLPTGALPPAMPAWCNTLTPGPSSFVEGPNSWSDDWEHGLTMGELGDGYREFTFGSVYRTATFRHMNHWMQDVAGFGPNRAGPAQSLGGASMRPDRSFQFVDGKLVIEAEVAAGVAEYGGEAWPEITVTTAPAPTGVVLDSLYHYGYFGGHWSLGMRLQSSRGPVVALYNPDRAPGNPAYFGTGAGRVFEMSHFQHIGAQVYGGEPGPVGGERDRAWRVCQGTDPDLDCRDRFRLELTKTSLTLYVNGTRYFQQSALSDQVDIPEQLIESPVYVYFAGTVYKSPGETVRFHWDRLAVNPEVGSTANPAAVPATVHSH